jgi:hypothetical protein
MTVIHFPYPRGNGSLRLTRFPTWGFDPYETDKQYTYGLRRCDSHQLATDPLHSRPNEPGSSWKAVASYVRVLTNVMVPLQHEARTTEASVVFVSIPIRDARRIHLFGRGHEDIDLEHQREWVSVTKSVSDEWNRCMVYKSQVTHIKIIPSVASW